MTDKLLDSIADLLDIDDEELPDTRVEERKTLNVTRKSDESEEACLARHALAPATTAANTISYFTTELGDLTLNSLVDELNKQTDAIKADGMGRAEDMLAIQAITLDLIFQKLSRKAALNMGGFMGVFESYLKLAFKAQSQSRAALETLSAIKNPPVAGYVNQANIAHGPQQVNNGKAAESGIKQNPSRARENEIPQTQLLEQTDGNRLDTGATSEAIEVDSTMATVGKIHRTEDTEG